MSERSESDPLAKRRAGILLHPTSLPGPHGIGDLGPSARAFADWLADAGMSLWQMLPLVPTDPGLCPYTGWSAFAGNPWLLSLEDLRDDGLVDPEALTTTDPFDASSIDVAAMRAHKGPLLRAAATRVVVSTGQTSPLRAGLERFVAEHPWAADAALFATLAARHGGPWWTWPAALAQREPSALATARRENKAAIDEAVALQFLFDRQLRRLREHCASRGIFLIGDIPIYVAPDSVDTWQHRQLFQLDAAGAPAVVAGVPPDYFSPTGQLWGSPLYDWEASAKEGYAWWIARMRRALQQADIVRLDHFRGFCAYWEVPADTEDARGGRWVPGPGRAIFAAFDNALGHIPIIAEDLGDIDDAVRELLATTGAPGMRVLEFAFGSDADNLHLPHNHPPNAVVYTSTHDNDTIAGWWSSIEPWERDATRRYLGLDTAPGAITWQLITAAMGSVASSAVVPMQDVLGLGSAARMNTPALTEGNWRWRVDGDALTDVLAERLRGLAKTFGRLTDR